MKPELKAMVEAYQRGYESQWDGFPSPNDPVNGLRESWLAALQWHGDELWCGPFCIASVWSADADGETLYMGGFGGVGGMVGDWKSKDEACAALEAAARQQIAQWLEEQSK